MHGYICDHGTSVRGVALSHKEGWRRGWCWELPQGGPHLPLQIQMQQQVQAREKDRPGLAQRRRVTPRTPSQGPGLSKLVPQAGGQAGAAPGSAGSLGRGQVAGNPHIPSSLSTGAHSRPLLPGNQRVGSVRAGALGSTGRSFLQESSLAKLPLGVGQGGLNQSHPSEPKGLSVRTGRRVVALCVKGWDFLRKPQPSFASRGGRHR